MRQHDAQTFARSRQCFETLVQRFELAPAEGADVAARDAALVANPQNLSELRKREADRNRLPNQP